MTFESGYTTWPFPMVASHGPWSLTPWDVAVSDSDPVSASWEVGNTAVYMPVKIPVVCILKRVWWANGATVSGGATVEAGIYSDSGYAPGTKVVSGSATQGTASQVQFVDVTDVTLPPGLYWLALMMSSTTNTTGMRISGSVVSDGARRFQQASANPLPSTATPVQSSNQFYWAYGFSTTTIT